MIVVAGHDMPCLCLLVREQGATEHESPLVAQNPQMNLYEPNNIDHWPSQTIVISQLMTTYHHKKTYHYHDGNYAIFDCHNDQLPSSTSCRQWLTSIMPPQKLRPRPSPQIRSFSTFINKVAHRLVVTYGDGSILVTQLMGSSTIIYRENRLVVTGRKGRKGVLQGYHSFGTQKWQLLKQPTVKAWWSVIPSIL